MSEEQDRLLREGDSFLASQVSFDIDANGIVSVSAKDQATQKEQSITVSGAGTLSDDEISKMVDEAYQALETQLSL